MTETKFNFAKSLVCVEYPGVVNNVDKMLETFGGINNISTAYGSKNRRLEVRFRPNDIFCKPICGDKYKTMALIFKTKIKRHKDPITHEITAKVISNEVIGRVHSIYKFTALCDFQYLTLHPDKDSELKCSYEDIVPTGMPSAAWIVPPAPYFLTPAIFSRIDTQQTISLMPDNTDPNIPHNVIGRTRRRRSGHAIFLNFKKSMDIPKQPNKISINLLQVKFLSGRHYNKVKKLFEERPIWSKNALMCITGFTREQLKYLLPSVAFYYVTGPWRIMWVRFGYDPRTTYESRIYQTLDFRLRTTGGMRTMIKAKRSYTNYLLPYKSSPSCRPKTVVISKIPFSISKSSRKKTNTENGYIFKLGMVPPSRQMFYQYCDLHVPEIEKMLERLPIPMPGTKCDSKLGWLPIAFDDQCREIIHNCTSEQLKLNAFTDTSKGKQKGLKKKTKISQQVEDEFEVSDEDKDDEDWSEGDA